MSILYLLTAPPPIFEGTDAVLQDVAALRAAFGGEIVNLSPPGSSIPRFPRQLCGLHKIAEIKRLEGKCKINHIFFLFPLPFSGLAHASQSDLLHGHCHIRPQRGSHATLHNCCN